MALDLRVVPPEVSFSDRKIRDSCSKVSVDYVPPTNFVLNARQVRNYLFTFMIFYLIVIKKKLL